MTQNILPLGHLAPKPDRLIGHDTVSGQVHQHLNGLVVVDDLPASHHVTKTVHGVAATKWVGLSGVAEKYKD